MPAPADEVVVGDFDAAAQLDLAYVFDDDRIQIVLGPLEQLVALDGAAILTVSSTEGRLGLRRRRRHR